MLVFAATDAMHPLDVAVVVVSLLGITIVGVWLGRSLQLDPDTERIVGDEEASVLLART